MKGSFRLKVKVFKIKEEEIDVDELLDKEDKKYPHKKKVRILAVNKYGIKTDWDDEKVDWVHIYDDYSVEVFKKKKINKRRTIRI